MMDKQDNFNDLQTCHFDQEFLKDIPFVTWFVYYFNIIWKLYPTSSKYTLHLNYIPINVLHRVEYPSKHSAWECGASQ